MRFKSVSPLICSFLLFLFFCTLAPKPVLAHNYNQSVSVNLTLGQAWVAQLELDKGQAVRIDLSGNGIVDFYFMDETNYSEYKQAESSGSGTFVFMPSLSQMDSSSIHKTANVTYSGTYYVVVSNKPNLNPVTATGRITATYGTPSSLVSDWAWIALIIVVIVIVSIAVAFVLRRSRS